MPNDTDAEIELTADKVELSKNGDLTQTQDGQKVVIAHFEKNTGYLEFTTREASVKLYQQVIARLGTVNKGKDPSTNVVRSFGVKGEKRVDLKSIPKRPKMGELGDCTKEVVDWYFEHNLPEAIIRYGVYTDENGKPIRRNVERKSMEMIDQREFDDSDIENIKTGRTASKAPVRQQGYRDQYDNQIIARRSTHMTFTPQEVRGGFDHEDYQPERSTEAEE